MALREHHCGMRSSTLALAFLSLACGHHTVGALSGGSGGGSAEGESGDGDDGVSEPGDEGSDEASDQDGGACSDADEAAGLSWAQSIENPGSENGFHIQNVAADGCGAFYVVGSVVRRFELGNGIVLQANVATGRSAGVVVKFGEDGSPLWGRVFESPGHDAAWAVAVVPDAVVVGGYFCDLEPNCTLTFDGGNAVDAALTSSGDAALDGFVAAYSHDGDLEWTQLVAGGIVDAIAADPSHGVRASGHFGDTVTFGGGAVTLDGRAINGSMFVARYDDGELAWARGVTTQGDSFVSVNAGGLAVDADGAALVGGTFGPLGSGMTSVSFGEGSSPIEATSPDGYVARLDPDGDLAWVRAFGGAGDDAVGDVDVAADGSVYVTGQFSETSTWGADQPTQSSLSSLGGSDVYLAKYLADGSFAWVARAGSVRTCGPSDLGNAVAAVPGGGAIVGGRYNGPLLFGTEAPWDAELPGDGYGNAFMAHYGADGSLRSAHGGVTGAPDCGGGGFHTAITVVNEGAGAIVAGEYLHTLDLDGTVFDGFGAAFVALLRALTPVVAVLT